MTNPNDPIKPLSWTARPDGVPELNTLNNGLTKREYFTAMAMQGFLANTSGTLSPEFVAKHSVAYADALINYLNTKQHG
jgi:hypothetical protein